MPEAEVSYLTLPEALQDIFVRQRTGVLCFALDEEPQRLLFLSGELYLHGTNPLRERLAEVLAGPPDGYSNPDFDALSYLNREMENLVRELADIIARSETQDFQFEQPIEEVPDDLVGPLQTGGLVMELCSRGVQDTDLLKRLGGLDASYRASDWIMRRRFPELDTAETALLDRLESRADIRTLIAESGGQASLVICHLARLSSVRLVDREDQSRSSRNALSPALLSELSKRLEQSLQEEPLALGKASHRARVGKILRDYADQDFFELLGVDGGSDESKIHAAYTEIGRLVHPSHASRLGMRQPSRRLEWLFGRLTEAYLVLSDPDRSAEYRRGRGRVPAPKVSAPDGEMRQTERTRLARRHYELAREHFGEDDFHYAIELLRQAVLADPRPEYHALLARCLRQNPRWLHMAIDSFREAVAGLPDDRELREELNTVTLEYRSRQSEAKARAGADDSP